MEIIISRAEDTEVRVKTFTGKLQSFAVLYLKTRKNSSVKMFFDSLEEIMTFAGKIQDEVMRLEREAQERAP